MRLMLRFLVLILLSVLHGQYSFIAAQQASSCDQGTSYKYCYEQHSHLFINETSRIVITQGTNCLLPYIEYQIYAGYSWLNTSESISIKYIIDNDTSNAYFATYNDCFKDNSSAWQYCYSSGCYWYDEILFKQDLSNALNISYIDNQIELTITNLVNFDVITNQTHDITHWKIYCYDELPMTIPTVIPSVSPTKNPSNIIYQPSQTPLSIVNSIASSTSENDNNNINDLNDTSNNNDINENNQDSGENDDDEMIVLMAIIGSSAIIMIIIFGMIIYKYFQKHKHNKNASISMADPTKKSNENHFNNVKTGEGESNPQTNKRVSLQMSDNNNGHTALVSVNSNTVMSGSSDIESDAAHGASQFEGPNLTYKIENQTPNGKIEMHTQTHDLYGSIVNSGSNSPLHNDIYQMDHTNNENENENENGSDSDRDNSSGSELFRRRSTNVLNEGMSNEQHGKTSTSGTGANIASMTNETSINSLNSNENDNGNNQKGDERVDTSTPRFTRKPKKKHSTLGGSTTPRGSTNGTTARAPVA